MSNFSYFFEPIQKGNTNLTEMAIYNSIKFNGEFIPLWGGNKTHVVQNRLISENGKTKTGSPITIFDGEGIIISLDGSAGSMTYKNGERFALNHHAGFFKVKDKMKGSINPLFFALSFEKKLTDISVSDGSKTLSLKQIDSLDFEMPDKKIQDEFISLTKPVLVKREQITRLLNKMGSIKNKIISNDYHEYQITDVNISDVFDYMSGNSGLTEKYLYSRISSTNEIKYKILTGSIDISDVSVIHQCSNPKNPLKRIKVFVGEGIHVVRKGKAGHVNYLPEDHYTLNDDAYILYLKNDCNYEISLKWITIQYKKIFQDYSSSSDNGTWNMTGFFKNVIIDIPSYKEQMKIVKEYEKIERLEKSMKHVVKRIENIFQKQLSF